MREREKERKREREKERKREREKERKREREKEREIYTKEGHILPCLKVSKCHIRVRHIPLCLFTKKER
jgi:hypothetical protein